MECNVMTITPQLAEEMLKKSTGNRTISRASVSMYARDIKNDNWALNGEPIVFDENGVLKNGHHRLHAVIEANKPITSLVVEDAPETWVYDANRVRTVRDQMMINGEDAILTSNAMQAAIRMHYKIQFEISKVSANEIKEFYERNSCYLDTVYKLALTKNTGGANVKKSSYTYALLCALVCGVPETVLTDFTNVVATGTFITAYDTPAMKLREHLMQIRLGTVRNRIETLYIAENAIADFASRKIRKNRYTTASKPIYSNQKIMRLI